MKQKKKKEKRKKKRNNDINILIVKINCYIINFYILMKL